MEQHWTDGGVQLRLPLPEVVEGVQSVMLLTDDEWEAWAASLDSEPEPPEWAEYDAHYNA